MAEMKRRWLQPAAMSERAASPSPPTPGGTVRHPTSEAASLFRVESKGEESFHSRDSVA